MLVITGIDALYVIWFVSKNTKLSSLSFVYQQVGSECIKISNNLPYREI